MDLKRPSFLAKQIIPKKAKKEIKSFKNCVDEFFNTALRVATVHLVTPDSLIFLSWQQCLSYFMLQKSKSQDNNVFTDALLPSLLAGWSPQYGPVCRLDDDLPPLEPGRHPGVASALPLYCRAEQVGLVWSCHNIILI